MKYNCPCCVITYAAINLTNKKFQVGSTTDFGRRCKQHHNSDENPEFHRALRKDPANFYWIVSEDDGLGTRDEEQYYLDFYHGTPWCYNLNPSASAPPSRKGATLSTSTKKLLSEINTGKKSSDETKEKMSNKRRGGENYNAIPIVMTLPGGEEEVFPCIKDACTKYGLQTSNLQGVVHGTRKQHKGFKARFA
jgi:hypothetical protein